jgi:ketose-bisphosphate aldolase
MTFIPSLDLIRSARQNGYAIPSFCFWNAESCDVILRVAARLRAPVILMASRSECACLPPRRLVAVARTIAQDYDIPVALHLDHGDCLEQVQECIDAGFSSVMLDYSTRPFSENVAALQQVVKLAKPLGITVEGELGHVGRADNVTSEGLGQASLTEPDAARVFVQETGVDMLAVSIGNAHGHYAKTPQLEFALLEKLRDATGIPLVLHGGSGTPPDDLRRAVALGMAKVNVASDLVSTLRQSLQDQWKQPCWLPPTFGVAIATLEPVLERWIHALGAAHRV